MLQKLTLPLSKECVLMLLHPLLQHPVSASYHVMLLMSGHTAHQPLRNSDVAYVLLLTVLYCCQHCIYTATLLLLQLQHLQLKSIQNIESTMFSMMHLSPESSLLLVYVLSLKNLCLLPTLH